MTKADLAREAVEKFPNTSKKAIASYLYKHNPLVFTDQEDARKKVREVTGKSGNSKGGHGYVKPTHKDIYKGLPKGEKNDFSPFVLAPGSYGVIADLHIPYHDLYAIECAIEHFLKAGIKNLILNGDIIDAYQISRFVKDPKKRGFKYEVDLLKSFLRELKKDFNIILKLGNHEQRWEMFLKQKAPEIYDLELNLLLLLSSDIVPRDEHMPAHRKPNDLMEGISYIPDMRSMKAGKLSIIHGNEISSTSPVNPAKGYYNKAKKNVLAAHRHQVSEHTAKDLDGKIHGSWSMGCCCALEAEYAPYNEWGHGFAEVHHDGDEFEVNNYKIINGKVK